MYENNSAKHKNIKFLFVDRTICILLNAKFITKNMNEILSLGVFDKL